MTQVMMGQDWVDLIASDQVNVYDHQVLWP